ncbi:MAG: IS256 family transposase [Candidatus Coatesbacteria bacterium]|nr:MAG: IS256 family transposase [Candidatus Coatesbacteria bacterium]
MSKKSTVGDRKSSPCWEGLEAWIRGRIQECFQDVLEEEVTEFLGRGRYERRKAIDGASGSRNGYGKPRNVTLSSGTITVRRPRVRGAEERFESRLLPLFQRRTKEVNELVPELYLHGLAEGDFDLALRGLLGEDAPISAATVGRLKKKWQAEFEQWSSRRLDDLEVVYLWVDGIYVKAGLEKAKAAVLVAIAGLSDGRKVVVAIQPGHRESIESWSSFLRDLKRRGMNAPRLVIGDGNLGIWGGLRNIYPEAREQRCWNHKMRNVLDKLPKRLQEEAKLRVRRIVYASCTQEAQRERGRFQSWCREHGHQRAAAVLDRGWEQMLTFFNYPEEHWRHIRTTNPVESPFASVRLRTNAAKRFKKVENATAVLWKMLMIAERRFKRLKAPELMKRVFDGVVYVDGREKQIDKATKAA